MISHKVREDFGYKEDGAKVLKAGECKGKNKSYGDRRGIYTPALTFCVIGRGCIDVNLPRDEDPTGPGAKENYNTFKSPNSASLCCRYSGAGNNYLHGIQVAINK